MNVLAVGCHPDDIEIGCGGTLIKCVRRGDRVTICHVASGNMGHERILPQELRTIRAEEARRGGAVLGAAEVISLDADDLAVDSGDKRLVQAMVALIRRVDPDLIVTHAPNDYMKDHVEVSRLVFDASFSATVAHYGAGACTHTFAPIFYMDTLAGVDFQPEQYVDITGEIEDKLAALRCHESQLGWMGDHDGIDFVDMTRTCAKFRGFQCSVPFAEGFQACKVYPRLASKPLLP